MGVTNGISIELYNPARSYFAGQVVEGRVVVQNQKSTKVKEITIMMEGTGRVSWSEVQKFPVNKHRVTAKGRTRSQTTTKSQTVRLSAEEKYISQVISLDGDGNNLKTLPGGTNAYPFQFILPSNLPSSFTSKTGLISYFLEAEMRRPLLKPNKKIAVPFTVNGIFDLNAEHSAGNPQEIKRIKRSNLFACRKGQVGFVLKLVRSGYVSGEKVYFSSEVTNSSNRVASMKASLKQVTTFYAQGSKTSDTKTVVELKGPSVDRGEHDMWTANDGLQLPALPPTRLGGVCRIIDVQYYLQFELNFDGLTLSSALSAGLPIMIGTIPLRNTFEQLRQPPRPPPPIVHMPPVPGPSTASPLSEKSQLFQDTILDEPRPVAPPSAPYLNEYPDLPPPSYAEAVMTESFTWEGAGTNEYNDEAGPLPSKSGLPSTSANAAPSAPPMTEFIPNYITYTKSNY